MLVVLVVFLFLREVWATIIPSVAVPLSLVGTFGVMYLVGYTIDNLSLMALTIATGFVVDDAIVVIENITRYLEMGMKPYEAAMKGSKEIGFTVLSMSTSLIAVFMPILLMGGIVGKLFREFAVTLSVAIAVSLLVSLTTTPMLCAQFLKSRDESRHGRIYRASESAFNWLHSEYAAGIALGAAPPVADSGRGRRHRCAERLPLHHRAQGLFPAAGHGPDGRPDHGRAGHQLSTPCATSSGSWRRWCSTIRPLQSVTAFVGGGGPAAAAPTWAACSSPSSRSSERPGRVSADQVVNRLRRKLTSVPGATLYLQAQQDIQIGGRGSAAQYQYTLSDENLNELNTWAPQLQAAHENHARAARRLHRPAEPGPGRQPGHRPRHRLAAGHHRRRHRPGALRRLRPARSLHHVHRAQPVLRGDGGRSQIPAQPRRAQRHLHQVLAPAPWCRSPPSPTIEKQRTSLQVNHQGQYPAVTLTFNLAPNVALGDAVTALEKVQREMDMPSSIHATFQGTAQAFQDSLKNEPWLILAALVAVYIVLGILYESLIHPLTILSTLPPAGVGAILALLLTGTELSIIALIGIILLIGIVKKNAIMMIDFALQAERDQGLPPVEAIYQACLLRFRPIMMTTMAALFGGMPLAIGMGVGSELRKPLGITIVGGLLVSQALTLFTTPVVYLFFDRLQWQVMKLHRVGVGAGRGAGRLKQLLASSVVSLKCLD